MSAADDAHLADVQSALAGVYSLERCLGRGGMGSVYLGRDVALDRPVAIKVLHPELAQRPEQCARFLAEARTGARLSHPNIAPIYAVDTAGDVVYFVMGLIDGDSLARRINAHGPLGPDTAERVLREVGWALGYAHAMGVLHRDVTLDNILVERTTGRAVLVDFGIAAEIERDDALPLIGTPAYIAPELVEGAAPSALSDLYALGICAWTMLAGRFPFSGDDSAAVLMQHVTTPLPAVMDAAPGTSRRLAAAITAALAKDPASRPASVETFLAALDARANVTALAAPLARWVRRGDRIRPLWAFAMPMVAMVTASAIPNLVSAFWMLGRYGRPGIGGYLLPLVRTMAIPLIAAVAVHLVFECRELRSVLRAGYGVDDLRLATRRRHRERQHVTVGLIGRVIHDLTWLAAIGLALTLVISSRVDAMAASWEGVRDLSFALADLGRTFWVVMWTGVGAGFVFPVSPIRATAGRWSERFWGSRAGRWMASVASIGLDRRRAPDHTLHRPTELVLELAIETCWHALPTAMQRSCAGLPAVAESLRERVSQTRELMQQLAEPDLARVPEAAALRERVQAQHDSAITALERLRLELMQLSGAVAPTGALTEQLRGARALEDELLRDLGAHPSVKRLLGKRVRSGSPGVTPQTA